MTLDTLYTWGMDIGHVHNKRKTMQHQNMTDAAVENTASIIDGYVQYRAKVLQEKMRLTEMLRKLEGALQEDVGAPMSNTISLPEMVKDILLKEGPKTKQAVLQEVFRRGYTFQTTNPMNSLNAVLYARGVFQHTPDGRFFLAADGPVNPSLKDRVKALLKEGAKTKEQILARLDSQGYKFRTSKPTNSLNSVLFMRVNGIRHSGDYFYVEGSEPKGLIDSTRQWFEDATKEAGRLAPVGRVSRPQASTPARKAKTLHRRQMAPALPTAMPAGHTEAAPA